MSSDDTLFTSQPFGADWELSPGIPYALPDSSSSTADRSSSTGNNNDQTMTSTPYIVDMFPSENMDDFPPSLMFPDSGKLPSFDMAQNEPLNTSNCDSQKSSAIACWASSICPSKEESGEYPGACIGICPLVPPMKSSGISLDDTTAPLTHVNSIKLETEKSLEKEIAVMEQMPPSRSRTAISAKTSRSSTTLSPTEKQSEETALPQVLKPRDRVPHKDIEKRYRTKINSQLEALRKVLPKHQSTSYGPMDIEDITVKHASKPVILTAAISYIKELEENQRRMEEELAVMKAKVQEFQAVTNCDNCSLVRYFNNLNILGPGSLKRQRH